MTEAYPVPSSSPRQARCLRVFPGEARQVPQVRAFVARALAGCPAREALLTCVSELAANAITHTASGAGGAFTVEVCWPAPGVARVAVTDAGAAPPADADTDPGALHEPVPVPAAAARPPGQPAKPDGQAATASVPALAEGGRGLLLVAACSSRWGYRDADEGAGRVVWAEATWPVAVGASAIP